MNLKDAFSIYKLNSNVDINWFASKHKISTEKTLELFSELEAKGNLKSSPYFQCPKESCETKIAPKHMEEDEDNEDHSICPQCQKSKPTKSYKKVKLFTIIKEVA